MKNSVDVYGAEGKSNVLFFDPEKLHLVTDESSPLYDSRVHLPIDEKMVRNIMAIGVIQAISVWKNPESGLVEVVVGRQRVKNAREANRRLVEQGREPIQVPAIPKRSDPSGLAGLMVSENEIREADSPIGRAEKMAKLLDLNYSMDQIGVLFGLGEQSVKATLSLLDCCSAVKAAVGDGSINVGHALKLSKMPVDEQKAKLVELKAAGEGVKGHQRSRKMREVVRPYARTLRSKKEIEERLKFATDFVERAALEWVLGIENTPPPVGDKSGDLFESKALDAETVDAGALVA